MIDPERRARIIAYNKRIQAERRKSLKVDEIKVLSDRLSRLPTPTELVEFLRKIREVLKDA